VQTRTMARKPTKALGIGAVIALACILSGCGTTHMPAGLRPHTPPLLDHQAGQGERARAYARHLMTELRLPAGARPAQWPARIRDAMKPMLPAIEADVVDVRALYRTSWPISQVNGFLTAQKPAGLLSGDAGQTSTAGSAAPTAYNVDFNPNKTPSWIYAATLATAVVPAQGGGSLLRVDAQVAWYPPRSNAEHIYPRWYRAVTVIRPGLKPNSRPRTRTFTAPAVVAKLAAVFNALPAEPDVTISCPEIGPGTTYQVVFTPAKRQWPRIVAGTSGCSMDTISVNGHQQPTLYDVGSLVAEVSRLFGGRHRT
jgi:hypothetical protein